jgi:hypothetical protein
MFSPILSLHSQWCLRMPSIGTSCGGIPGSPEPLAMASQAWASGLAAASQACLSPLAAASQARPSPLAVPGVPGSPAPSRGGVPGSPEPSRGGVPGSPEPSRDGVPGSPEQSRGGVPGSGGPSRGSIPGSGEPSRGDSPLQLPLLLPPTVSPHNLLTTATVTTGASHSIAIPTPSITTTTDAACLPMVCTASEPLVPHSSQ